LRLEKRSALAGVKPVSAGDDEHPAATTVGDIELMVKPVRSLGPGNAPAR
jgi:hypothetical protein